MMPAPMYQQPEYAPNYQGQYQDEPHYELPPEYNGPSSVSRPAPVNFNMFEGSPSYKQRRRRQSIPTSMLLADQAAQAQENRATDRSQSENLHDVAEEDDYNGHESAPRLSYEAVAEIERSLSRAGSEHENGSPYSTKSYTCPVPNCSRLFKRLEHLKRHVRTHTQERPYVCEYCGRNFSRSDNLAAHRKTHDRSGSSQSMQDYYSHDGNTSYEDSSYSEGDNGSYIPGGMAGMAPTSNLAPGNGYTMADYQSHMEYNNASSEDADLQARLQDHMNDNNSYIPSPRLVADTGLSAPRGLNEWQDDDATPRQSQFNRAVKDENGVAW